MPPLPPASVRPLSAEDLPSIKALIDAVGLFPSGMLDDMTRPALEAGADEIWLAAGGNHHQASAVAYCVPERMTDGTWNLLLVAVDPKRQRSGIGRAMVGPLERVLAERGARILLVETSALPHYAATRAFYAALGFAEEARIRDFYQAGEDKVVFRKELG